MTFPAVNETTWYWPMCSSAGRRVNIVCAPYFGRNRSYILVDRTTSGHNAAQRLMSI
jgi:hypothetical protein